MAEMIRNRAGAVDEDPDTDAEHDGDDGIAGEVGRERGGGAVAQHAVDRPAGDVGEGGVAQRDRDRGDGERNEEALQVQSALEEFPPEPGVELGLEFVFLLKGGGHGGSAKSEA
ncbi:MAG TPA: hypothetical protein PKX00_04020 [Opitutaceae bacterium]|nr:hypothetical protein [Opitutaceae bacterium]